MISSRKQSLEGRKASGPPLQHLAFIVGLLLLIMAAVFTFMGSVHLLVGSVGGDPKFALFGTVALLMLPGLAMPGGLFVMSFWLKDYPRLCRATIAAGVLWGFTWTAASQFAAYWLVFPMHYANMVKQTGVALADTAFWISVVGGTGMYLGIFAFCIACLVYLPVR